MTAQQIIVPRREERGDAVVRARFDDDVLQHVHQDLLQHEPGVPIFHDLWDNLDAVFLGTRIDIPTQNLGVDNMENQVDPLIVEEKGKAAITAVDKHVGDHPMKLKHVLFLANGCQLIESVDNPTESFSLIERSLIE